MAIYIGSQKIKPSGISKIYFGSQLVYQKTYTYTIYDDGQHYLCAPLTGDYGNYIDCDITNTSNRQYYIIQKFDNSGRIYWNKAWGSKESGGVACQLNSGSSKTAGLNFYLMGSTVSKSHSTASNPSTSQWVPNMKTWCTINFYGKTFRYANNEYNHYTTHTLNPGSSDNAAFQLFGYDGSSTGNGWKLARVEIKTITSSGTTTNRNMFPCKRSDGVLGMYDKQNSVFYPILCRSGMTDGSQYFHIEDENGNIVS